MKNIILKARDINKLINKKAYANDIRSGISIKRHLLFNCLSISRRFSHTWSSSVDKIFTLYLELEYI